MRMKTLLCLALAALLVAIVVPGVQAQVQPDTKKIESKTIDAPPAPVLPGMDDSPTFMGKFMLLRDKGVQKDMKLTEGQVKMIVDLDKNKPDAEKNIASAKEFATSVKKTIGDLMLTKDQSKRLGELILQARGPRVFLDAEVQKELGVTKDQVAKLSQSALTSLTGISAGFTPEENSKKIGEALKAGQNDVLKTLTADQQGKWKMLIGTPYDGVLPPVLMMRDMASGGRGALQPPPLPPGGKQL
jgi:hypothetical protein